LEVVTMSRLLTLAATAALLLAGCLPAPTDNGGLPGGDSTPAVGDTTSEQDLPEVPSGRVVIRVINTSTHDADVTTTMRTAGVRVHFAQRRVPASARDIIIGPDRTDSILIEGTLIDDTPRALPTRILKLGQDFQSGDEIEYVITNGDGDSGQLTPLTLALNGLDADRSIERGTAVDFTAVAGGFRSGATLRAFADPDSDPDNGNELPIATDLPAAAQIALSWDTTSVPPGTYAVYAVLEDTDRSLRFGPAPGRVIVSEPEPPALSIAILGLSQDLAVVAGTDVSFSVTLANFSPTAAVDVWAEDAGGAGSEIFIASWVPAAAALPFAWTTSVPPGTYVVKARVSDGPREALTAAAGRVIVQPAIVPLSVQLFGPSNDLNVNPGTLVYFSVQCAGFSADSTLTVVADPAALEGKAASSVVVELSPAVSLFPGAWDTTHMPPGLYRLRATLTDGDESLEDTATHTVRVNALPTLVFDAPRDGLLVTRGQAVVISWAGTDTDDAADITIFIDRDGIADSGDETVLRENIAANDPYDREYTLATAELPTGVHYVGGTIDDGLARLTVYAGSISVTTRLVGRFSADTLGSGLTTLQPGSANVALGVAIDISEDLDGDGRSDVLVTDPSYGAVRNGDGQGGKAYLHLSPEDGWPASFAVADSRMVIGGEQYEQGLGASAALLPSVDGDVDGDILLGAPYFRDTESWDNGRAYLLSGRPLLTRPSPFNLSGLSSPLGAYVTGDDADMAGLLVASIGDLDGDGYADAGIGAPGAGYSDAGRIALLRGGALPSSTELDNLCGDDAGVVIEGLASSARTGAALCRVPDLDDNGADELFIGAPGETLWGPDAAGAAFLVFGSASLFTPYGCESLWLSDLLGDADAIAFRGEHDGDEAGAALAVLDFNGDTLPDLVIGAPGYDDGRGRVYIVPLYALGLIDLSEPPFVLNLADVASGVLPGTVIDGLASGDGFGRRLAVVDDHDGDGFADLLIGAPYAESERGAAYLLYGSLFYIYANTLALADLGTAELPGWEFVGAAPGLALGSALSGGDVDGDDLADAAVGAPGTHAGGRAFIVHGRTCVGSTKPDSE
jgi:hypothetical protein